ncbi:hypothetical protein [Actinoplanes teichomyceticus]|uniref:Uncharacterized protein n=1 Tax=Actinoplanes teichomyceticus TaxID=1867 RepID=A0A561WMI0_ACTTI|nr:hypothetical protein [Actinoplanes teichomyceticus]TWG25058.1 hypothetical protein FHX34_10117 [Actinoplanes teichomyceticus]GIF10128.1 hypothetical protein Ate01nite_01600 [Actinoplanes teichomyceticus]
MTDRFRVDGTPEPSSAPPPIGRLRPALWLLLIVSLTVNAVASAIGATLAGIAFGLVTLACAGWLVVDHYRRRNQ